jgi:hypothetical protein
MATEVSGENYDSLLKEMETLKGRLDEERLKLNDVACMIIQKPYYCLILCMIIYDFTQYPQFLNVLKEWPSYP